MLTDTEFEDIFEIVPNNANGNCLFETMEYLLLETTYANTNVLPKAAQIRKMVADFYKDFDIDINYPMDTIEYNIKIGIMFDNIDNEVEKPTSLYNLDEMGIHHIYKVANPENM
jgi:hypothetical protein